MKRRKRKYTNDKIYRILRDNRHGTCKHRGVDHNICNLKYNGPNEIPVVFQNGSSYEYHFITEELGIEFEGELQY